MLNLRLLCGFVIDIQTAKNIIKKNFMRYARFKDLTNSKFETLKGLCISKDH